MRNFIITAILSLSVYSTLAQKANVHVKIQNDTEREITVKIFSADSYGGNESLVESYKVQSHKVEEFDIKNRFKKLESIVAKTVINGVNFNREMRLLKDKNNHFVYVVDALKEDNVKIVDLLSLESILDIKKETFLIENDISDKPVNGLFTTYLGGIVLYSPKERKIVKVIWPSTLGYTPQTYSPDPNYFEQNYFLKNSSTNSIKSDIPAIAGVNLNFKTNSLIKTNIILKGKKTFDIGDMPLKSKSVDQALDDLDEVTICNIGALFLSDDGLEIRQINRGIVVDCMVIELEELQEVSGEANLRLSNAILEGNRAYEKNSQNKKKILMGSSYFGFWSTDQGNPYPAFKMKSKQMATAFIKKLSNKNAFEKTIGLKIEDEDWGKILTSTKIPENNQISKEDDERLSKIVNFNPQPFSFPEIKANAKVQDYLWNDKNLNIATEAFIKSIEGKNNKEAKEEMNKVWERAFILGAEANVQKNSNWVDLYLKEKKKKEIN